MKTPISPCSLPWGMICQVGWPCLTDRNSILMIKINVDIIKPIVMGFQIKICLILCWEKALLLFRFWNKILVGWEKKVLSFLSYFKTLSIGLVSGIESQTALPLPLKQYVFLCANSVAVSGWNFVSSSVVLTGLWWFNTLFILRDPSGRTNWIIHLSGISTVDYVEEW